MLLLLPKHSIIRTESKFSAEKLFSSGDFSKISATEKKLLSKLEIVLEVSHLEKKNLQRMWPFLDKIGDFCVKNSKSLESFEFYERIFLSVVLPKSVSSKC